MARNTGNLNIEFDSASVAAVDLERSCLTGDNTVNFYAALGQFVIDESDHADLLSRLFHNDKADNVVTFEAEALFLELGQNGAAVYLAGDAALGVGCCTSVYDLGLFECVSGFVVHLVNVYDAAVGIITHPLGGITDVDMVHMTVVHNARACLCAVDDADDAAPLIAEHIFIAELL